MKHYFDIDNAKDKAIHVLFAGFVCGYYDKTIEECVEEFGEKTTEEAVEEFNQKFKENCKIIA